MAIKVFMGAPKFMFIKIMGSPSETPLIDQITCKMAAAMREAPGKHYGAGKSLCSGSGCGARVANIEHKLDNGAHTHMLAVHYLAYHRNEVPVELFEAIMAFPYCEVTPTHDELGRPVPPDQAA